MEEAYISDQSEALAISALAQSLTGQSDSEDEIDIGDAVVGRQSRSSTAIPTISTTYLSDNGPYIEVA